jgi:hypothetical protein
MKKIRVFKFDPDLDSDPLIFINTGPGLFVFLP